MSGFDVCGWDGSQGEVDSGWPFLQSVLHFFVPAFPLDRNNSGSRNLKMGVWPHASNGSHVYLLDMKSLGSISSMLGILAKVIPTES